MTQMLSDAGLDIDAQTIHATLMCMPTEYGFEFLHTAENPLPYKYVIVDEASMLSGSLTQSLLRAIGTETHLLLVGDPDQLPPVEIGATLRDLIAAGVPNGHLTEIIRNDGQIVKACHEIRNSRTFIPAFNVLATPEQNLVCINKMTSIDKTLRTLIGNRTANEIQIVVAVNSKTNVALDVVNKEAKAIWNPSTSTDGGRKLEIGDKVLCSKNGDVPLAVQKTPKEKETWRVANGDIGFIIGTRKEETIIELDGATVSVPWTHETKVSMNNFSLGYAMTAHKSQGNEWPVVIIFLDDSFNARMVCDRHWLYTAISRAKNECYLVGDIRVAYDMIKRSNMWNRKTFLAESIVSLQYREFFDTFNRLKGD